MGHDERIGLLREIEQERGSKVLVYFTGDRLGLEAIIAADSMPFCIEHLSNMGRQDKIDLFIYSKGGITVAGYSLVNMIREFCDSFGVIVPFKALSTATLMTLGANEIIMTKMGQLSPIDPSVMNPLCPRPSGPGVNRPVPVNVEDVKGYLALAKEHLTLEDEDSRVRIFELLAENVGPLVLGQVQRTSAQIEFMAKRLLEYHMTDDAEIESIAKSLISGRHSHDYVIGRKEAKETLGLKVIDVPDKLNELILRLYREYDGLLELSKPYHPESVLGTKDAKTGRATFVRAIIESTHATHVFKTEKEVKRALLVPPAVPEPTESYMERVTEERWFMDNDI